MSALVPVPDFMPDNDIDKKTMINAYLYFNNFIEDCYDFSDKLKSFFDSITTNNINFRYKKNCQKLCIMLIQKILTKKTISNFNKNVVIIIINFLQTYYDKLLIDQPADIETFKSNVSFTISFIYYCLNNKKINATDINDADAIRFSEIFSAINHVDLAIPTLQMGVTNPQTGGLKKDNKKIIKKNPIKKDNKKPKEKSKKK
jgi:hypothetical protein